MSHITRGTFYNQFAVAIADLDHLYRPGPPRPVRKLATQAEHDRREQLARIRAKAVCRSYGGNPDQVDRATGEPQYLEFFADALEQVDAEMVKDDWLKGRMVA